MSTVRLCLRGLVGLSCFVAWACESGGGGGGSGPFGSYTPKDPAAAMSDAEQALSTCSSSCSADVRAGRAALAAGDLSGALAAYECADSPEAAFGAGLATVLASVESERADRVLADFGVEPFSASDIIGADGYLSRNAARWQGGGTLTMAGALTGELMLNEAFAEASQDSFDSGTLSANGGNTTMHASLQLYGYATFAAGATSSLLYDCTSGSMFASLATQPPTIYLDIRDDETGRALDCSIPFSRDPTFCQQDLGTIQLNATGTQIDEEVSITLVDVTLSCLTYDGPGTDTVQDVTFNGTVMASVSDEVDTSDLHYFLRGDAEDYDLGRIPGDIRVNDLLAHATALSGDFAKAACLFDRAAEGSGEVFSVPGALLGGEDVAAVAADAKLLSALASGAAAVLQIGGAYASDLPLRDVACMLDQGDSDSPACQTTAVHVARVNAAIDSAGVRRDRLAAARVFLARALEGFRAAAPEMDETTIFPRNALSGAGWDAMVAIAEALQASLEDGEATLPFVSPSVSMQLERLLSDPPAPSSVQLQAFSYEEHCDDFECYSDLDLSPTYCSILWSPLGLDFDGDYETGPEGEDIEDAFEAFFNALEARAVFRGSDF